METISSGRRASSVLARCETPASNQEETNQAGAHQSQGAWFGNTLKGSPGDFFLQAEPRGPLVCQASGEVDRAVFHDGPGDGAERNTWSRHPCKK
jgi:hypothetical protein